jgi:hypothetical protein
MRIKVGLQYLDASFIWPIFLGTQVFVLKRPHCPVYHMQEEIYTFITWSCKKCKFPQHANNHLYSIKMSKIYGNDTSGCLNRSFFSSLSSNTILLLVSRVHMTIFSTKVSWSSRIRSDPKSNIIDEYTQISFYPQHNLIAVQIFFFLLILVSYFSSDSILIKIDSSISNLFHFPWF